MSDTQYNPPQDKGSSKAQAKADKAYRKASRPFYKKPIFILLAIILVIVIIVIATSTGSDSEGSSDTAQPAGPSFNGQQEDDLSAAAGESIDLDGVVTTTTPLVEGESIGTDPVLCTTATIQNNSEDPANFNGGFDWSLQDPNGASRMTTLGGSDTLLGAGDLVPGGNVTGDVCFDVPDASAGGEYVVIYEPTFSFSSDRAAWINNR